LLFSLRPKQHDRIAVFLALLCLAEFQLDGEYRLEACQVLQLLAGGLAQVDVELCDLLSGQREGQLAEH
jgi:hypothetical protein